MAKKLQNKAKAGKALKCPVCGKEFYRPPCRLARTQSRPTQLNYCSRICLHEAMRDRTSNQCAFCGKEFRSRKNWRVSNKYCSLKCRNAAKKKHRGVRYWKGRLDVVFSQYIRLRDITDGVGSCCSCGKKVDYSNADAGHYVHRGKTATRFDERNVHLQCRRCNRYEEGNAAGYAIFMLDKYGEETLRELERLSRQIKRFTAGELEEKCNDYAKRVEKMLQVKDRGWFEREEEISDKENGEKATNIFLQSDTKPKRKSRSISTGNE